MTLWSRMGEGSWGWTLCFILFKIAFIIVHALKLTNLMLCAPRGRYQIAKILSIETSERIDQSTGYNNNRGLLPSGVSRSSQNMGPISRTVVYFLFYPGSCAVQRTKTERRSPALISHYQCPTARILRRVLERRLFELVHFFSGNTLIPIRLLGIFDGNVFHPIHLIGVWW